MPKAKNSSLFANRNAVILFVSDNGGLARGDMLIGPLAEEIRQKAKVQTIEVVKSETPDIEGTDRTAGTVPVFLNAINHMMSTTKPVIVEVPMGAMLDDSPDVAMFRCYIRMLTMASGGFIVNAGPGVESEHILAQNTIVPEINFNTVKDSWCDLQPRVEYLVRKMADPDNVRFYSLMSTIGARVRRSNLGICLGDVSRMWVDIPSEDTGVKLIVNLSGDVDSPIGIGEFSERVWCNPSVPAFDPDRTLIARTPSSFSRMAIGKIMTGAEGVDGFRSINI